MRSLQPVIVIRLISVIAGLMLSFDAVAQINILRGPYLQQTSDTSIIIHWRTNTSCDSKVWFGKSTVMFTDSISDTSQVIEHVVKIKGLSASSRYYYTIGNSDSQLVALTPNYFFDTHPSKGREGLYRFWVIGDAGTGDNNQRRVRDAFFNYNQGRKLNGWIWLGDNAYNYGYDSEYQNAVFANNTYENIVSNLTAWAAPGNHDYGQNPGNPAPDFLDIFDFPANAECGGFPSATERYFSWDHGNIHFLQLDSYGSDRSDTGAQAQWMKADLLANQLPWVIAYFHHPPYTKGNHDSDNQLGYDPELPEVRNGLVRVLEEYGVDLVLCGHSHSYERSPLIDGYYDVSDSLKSEMIIDSSLGNYPAVCAYKKDTLNGKTHKGTVYVVAGVSGKISGVQSDWPHPVMHVSKAFTYGSMLLEIHGSRLNAFFIDDSSEVLDSFMIVKQNVVRRIVEVCKDSSIYIKPQWNLPALWVPANITADSVLINTSTDTFLIATDLTGCLTDSIHVVVHDPCIVGQPEMKTLLRMRLFPNPANECVRLEWDNAKSADVFVYNVSGLNVVKWRSLYSGAQLDLSNLTSGMYFISARFKDSASYQTRCIIIRN